MTPREISEEWTEELLVLMFRSREKRMKAYRDVVAPESKIRITDRLLFSNMRLAVQKRN